MTLDKVCCCRSTRYTLLPTILVTPAIDYGLGSYALHTYVEKHFFIVAFKFWTFHLGFRFVYKTLSFDINGEIDDENS